VGVAGSFVKANLAVLVVIIIVSASLVFAVSSIPAKMEAYTIHEPIVITNDSEFTAANGVVSGSGAPADPYVISGWQITVNSGAGISISDTFAYFMIVDVHINGTESPAGSVTGISFVAVEKGQIKNCLINDTNCAVDILWSYDCSVHGNEFLDTVGWAMNIQNCNRMHVVDNYFLGQNGIQAGYWQNSNVILNEFLQNEMCISASDVNTLVVKENIATDCGHPVSLSWSTNIQVLNNMYVGCMYGVEFSHVTYADIKGNVIEGATATGIDIRSSSYIIVISDNVVNGTEVYGGMMIEDSWEVEVTRNMISNNTNGFGYTGGGITLLTGCSDMLIFNNSFMYNAPQQAEDRNGPVIRWNETYPLGGNYWSDYAGADAMSGPDQDILGEDGFGDTPVVIDVDSASFYPLMIPVPVTVRPIAEFTMDPTMGDVTMLITFNASSSHHPDPARNITGYRWDFDCDGIFDAWSSDPVITHLYPVPGNYTIMLEVEDEDDMTDITTHVITILEEGIIPEFGTVLAPVLAVIAFITVAFGRRIPPLADRRARREQ